MNPFADLPDRPENNDPNHGFFELRNKIIVFLAADHTYQSIADLLSEAGYPLSRQAVHAIAKRSDAKPPRRDTATAVEKKEILELIEMGFTTPVISEQFPTLKSSAIDAIRSPKKKGKKHDDSLKGNQFGNLIALEYAGESKWLCENVITGDKSVVYRGNLINGTSLGLVQAKQRHREGELVKVGNSKPVTTPKTRKKKEVKQ